MPEIVLIRHGQASFGTDNYDRLSETGHLQSHAAGKALAQLGIAPIAIACGEQQRHHETLDGLVTAMDLSHDRHVLPGLNEFAFGSLLRADLGDDDKIVALKKDPRAYFKQMKATVLAWQRDELDGPPETFTAFKHRVTDALERLAQLGDGPVLAASSGGPISLMTAMTVGAPVETMIKLQMQLRNCAMARFIASNGEIQLASFNEAPHITADNAHKFLTYH